MTPSPLSFRSSHRFRGPSPRTAPFLERLEDRILLDSGGGEIGAALMTGAHRDSVANLYRVLLRREPSAGEVDAVAGRLDAGTPVAALAPGFLVSPEYRTSLIAAGYQGMLGRTPDGGGAAFWGGLLAGGLPDDRFCAALLASDEYFARHGTRKGDASIFQSSSRNSAAVR